MNFKNIIPIVCLALALGACTDLEVQEVDSVVVESSGDGFVAGDPTELLAAAYNDLSAFTDQANIYALFEHSSDEMIPPTRGVDWGDNGVWRTLHQHNWDPTHAYVLGAWNQLNERAFKTNQIIASSPSAQEAAEAKFLRAFYVWNVADLYGQVPFREVDEGVDVDPRVLSRSEAISFAIQDLNEAMADLPDLGPAVGGNLTASKASANALLARIYLNKGVYDAANPAGPYEFSGGDMDQVIAAVDAITASGYTFESEYFKAFSGESEAEQILSSVQGSPQNRWMMTLHYSQNPSGWNGFTTLADFYNKFDANDPRIGNYPPPDGSEFSGIGRGFLEGQQFADDGSEVIDSRTQKPLQFVPDVPLSGAATDKGIRVVKYHPATADKYIIFRYGEAIMNKAEAQFRKGDEAGALATINELRAARGAPMISSLSEESLLDERGFELYWEASRRMDQIRFGTYADAWSEKSVQETFRVIYPIPQQALDSNPNLTQNEGY